MNENLGGRILAARPEEDEGLLRCEAMPVTIVAAKDDKDAPPTFEMVAYAGAKMNLTGWDLPVVIDLEGLSVPDRSIPILRDHWRDRIVGHSQKIEIGKKDLRIAGIISGSGQHASEVVKTSQRGFPWQASVGARTRRIELVEKDASVRVNGTEHDGPLYVARESVLEETSFVSLGADEQTSASVAAERARNGKESNMDFDKWLKAKGLDPAEMSDEEKAAQRVLFDAEVKAGKKEDGAPPAEKPEKTVLAAAAPTAEDIVAETRKQLAAEHKRVSEIRAVCGDEHSEIAGKAIAEGWSKDRAELEVLRASSPRAPAVITGANDVQMGARVLEAAIRLGSEEKAEHVEKDYDEKTLDAAYKHRTTSIRAFIEKVCRMEGRAVPLLGDGPEIWAAAGFSTVNVPGILGNTANKLLVSAFNAVPSAAVRVGKKLSAKDFKTHTGYRVGDGTVMEKVGGAGELKHGDLSEGSFTFYVDTYGEIIGISRRAWINDDLGAFTAIPLRIGRKAARTREKLFWDLVKANTGSFFSSGNKNVSTSTGVDAAGYDAATKVMEEMTDDDGNEILVLPKFVVVPPALAGAARRMFKSSNLAVVQLGSTSAKKLEGMGSNYEGVYEPISVPHLRSGATPAGSDTTYYLFADPNDVAAFGIAYLNGVEAPTVEKAPLPSDCLGQAWRGYFDVGVCQVDEQGAVKCTA